MPVIKTFIDNKPSNPENEFIRIPNKLGNDFWMYIRPDSHIETILHNKGLYGSWEKESLKIWALLSKRSDYIVDIGANTGIYSLVAQAGNLHAKVFAIEPVDINYEILSNNIERNNFVIVPERIAISSNEGTAKMFMIKDKLNYMTSVNDNRYEKHPEIAQGNPVIEIEVPLKPFNYLIDKYHIPKIDLIKIDVEGHEVAVLKSMFSILKKYRPAILIEVIGDENAVELQNIFSQLEYAFVSIDEINKSVVVKHLKDNDHHNFLVCDYHLVEFLRSNSLVE